MKVRAATIFDLPAITTLRKRWFEAFGVPYYEREGTQWLVAEEGARIQACLGYVFSAGYNQYHITDLYRQESRAGLRGVAKVTQRLESIADEFDAALILHIHPQNAKLMNAANLRGYDFIEVNMFRSPRSQVKCLQQ